MNVKCHCPGAVCTCGAEGIVKDGHGVRLSMMAMDGSISGEKHVTDVALADARVRAEAARDHYIEDLARRSGGVGKNGRVHVQYDADEQGAYDLALADAKSAGLTDERAAAEAARAVMIHNQAHAWKGA